MKLLKLEFWTTTAEGWALLYFIVVTLSVLIGSLLGFDLK